MPVLLVTHHSSLHHVTPEGHPERAGRVVAVLEGARSSTVPVVEMEAPKAPREILEMVHTREHIEYIDAFCSDGGGALDADTYAVPASYLAALHAAGAGPAVVDTLEAGGADAAFVVLRPPGHHAERGRAMGFCLFNNVAVTAAYLRNRGERVAVVDWDVHHGNGTQSIFYRDSDVLYVSVHEFPFYPGTGWMDEQGEGPGVGATVNVPLPGGTGAEVYLEAFARIVIPVLEQFAPDWILVSNGYDAHRLDPLGGLLLESEHYGWMARAVAEQVSNGRVIAVLEGGYDAGALAESATATLDGLGGIVGDVVWPGGAVGSAGRVIDLAVEELGRHWNLR